MGIQIRSVGNDEAEAFVRSMGVCFDFDPSPDRLRSFPHIFEITHRLES
jgi:hypothetical protein